MRGGKMEIRKFIRDDIAEVLDICREVRDYHIDILGGYFKPQDDGLEQTFFLNSLDDSNIIALVAEENGTILGYLLAEKKDSPHLLRSRIVHISNFGVRKGSQGQGIGHSLMDALYDICRQDKIEEIRLGVYNNNKSAYRFYKDYGFEEFEQRMHIKLPD